MASRAAALVAPAMTGTVRWEEVVAVMYDGRALALLAG